MTKMLSRLSVPLIAVVLLSSCGSWSPGPDEPSDSSGPPEPNGGFQVVFRGDPVLLQEIERRLKAYLNDKKSCERVDFVGASSDRGASSSAHPRLTYTCVEPRPNGDIAKATLAEGFGRVYALVVLRGQVGDKLAALGNDALAQSGSSSISMVMSNSGSCKQMECPQGRPGWFLTNSPICKRCDP